MDRRTFLAASTTALAAPFLGGRAARAQTASRAETLLLVQEYGPNSLDMQGLGSSQPLKPRHWREGVLRPSISPVNRTGPDGDSDDRVQAACVALMVAQYAASYSAGGTSLQAECRRWVFHQWTQAEVASSTCSTERQGPWRLMSSAL